MRALVIGANGRTGTQLIDLGLARGHELTAFVRSPAKITRTDPRLHVVQGDPHSADALAAALPGHDVVLSALGIHTRQMFGPVTLLQDCVASTVAAMTRAGVKRLVLVSAATLFPEDGLKFRIARWVLQHQIRDLVATESIVRATALDWTLARPPRLVSSREEAYRAERDALPKDGFTMSFRAVAAFMLDSAAQGTHREEIVGLAAP